MSFLDNVLNKGKNVVSSAGKVAEDTARFSKLKMRESQLNNSIRSDYEKLGELIYQMAKSGEKDDAAFDEKIATIDGYYAELADIAKKFDEIKNLVTCEKCGNKCKDDMSYCPKCGAKLPEKPAPVEEEKPAETASDTDDTKE